MPAPRRKASLPLDRDLMGTKPRKGIPHAFVLEALSPLAPFTRPLFSCLAIYVGEKIVLALRDKPDHIADNGVWLATEEVHHASLRLDFPNMRSIQVFDKPVTGWQILAADTPDFEEAALRACEFITAGDPRIGKVPKPRRSSSKARKAKPFKKTTAT